MRKSDEYPQLNNFTSACTAEKKDSSKAAIIVLNWNNWQDTIECLESLQRLTYPNYQVIVVDNGSSDGSLQKIKAWAQGEIPVESKFFGYDASKKPLEKVVEYDRSTAEIGGIDDKEYKLEAIPSFKRLILISNGKNIGFAAGNNVAIRYALKRNYGYIGLLNNDTVVGPDYPTSLINILKNETKWIAVSPKILLYDEPERIWWSGGRLDTRTGCAYYLGHGQRNNIKWTGKRQVDCFSGCCFVARASTFEKIGLFDEEMFFGVEEFAYGWLAKRQKLSICVDLDQVIYHKWGRTWRDNNQKLAPFVIYHSRRQWLIMIYKYAGILQKLTIYTYYLFTRIPHFVFLMIVYKQAGLIIAELKAIRDFFRGNWKGNKKPKTIK